MGCVVEDLEGLLEVSFSIWMRINEEGTCFISHLPGAEVDGFAGVGGHLAELMDEEVRVRFYWPYEHYRCL